MKENIEILNNYQKSISHYSQLKISEAKELYKKMLESNSKNNYFNDLITGTLYVIVKFIYNDKLILFNSPAYDMDDIINICNEIWINKIKSGKLLKVNRYCEMFDGDFYAKLNDGLGVKNYEVEDIGISLTFFAELLEEYIKYRQKNSDFKYNKFIEYIFENYRSYYNFYQIYNHEDNLNLSNLLDAIYNSFKLNDSDILTSKTKLNKIKHILINNGYEYLKLNLNRVIMKDPTDKLIDNYCEKELLQNILNSNLKDTYKDVLIKRFGLFDNERKTCDEIAHELGVSRCRIQQIEAKTLRILRNKSNIKQYRNLI